VSRERPNGAQVHQYLPYLVLKYGYLRLQVAPSFEVPQWPTQVHPNRDGFLGHLLTGSLGAAYRDVAKIEQKFEHGISRSLGL
jgi:hypothetical protein